MRTSTWMQTQKLIQTMPHTESAKSSLSADADVGGDTAAGTDQAAEAVADQEPDEEMDLVGGTLASDPGADTDDASH